MNLSTLPDLRAAQAPDAPAVAAAPASVELLTKFETRYGIPLVEGYGLSERTCASTAKPLEGKRKAGTVGPRCRGRRFGSWTPTMRTFLRVRPARS